MGPERHAAIATLTGEPHALVRQPGAEAAPARDRIDQQQSQAGDRVGVLDQKHASDVLAVHVGDPAAVVVRVVLADEVGDDLRAQALEVLRPAIFLRIELAVAGDHPAEIAGLRFAQDDVALRCSLRRHHGLDRAHRGDEIILLGRGQPAEQGADLLHGPRFERIEGLASARCQRQDALPTIVGRDVLADQPALVEPAQDAAEVAGIEAEIATDLGRGGAAALPDLVQHARLGQRERAVEPAVLQHAEILRVEAVEAAHRGDALRLVSGRNCHAGSIGQLLDGVKYLAEPKYLAEFCDRAGRRRVSNDARSAFSEFESYRHHSPASS